MGENMKHTKVLTIAPHSTSGEVDRPAALAVVLTSQPALFAVNRLTS